MTRLLTGAGVLVLVGLLMWLYGAARYDAGRLVERSVWQAKTAAATLEDLSAKARLDAARAAATQESADDLEDKMADALARAAHHSVKLRDTAPRDRGEPDMSGTAEPPAAVDDPSEAAVLADSALISDSAVCAENTVKAQGWQDWWRAVSSAAQ